MLMYSEGNTTKVLLKFSTEIIRPKIETLSFHDEVLWEKVLPSFIVKLNLHLDLVNKTRLLY